MENPKQNIQRMSFVLIWNFIYQGLVLHSLGVAVYILIMPKNLLYFLIATQEQTFWPGHRGGML